MSSPNLETFCCASSESHPSVEWMLKIDIVPYNAVSIVSSCIGILGALYQVIPQVEEGGPPPSRRHLISSRRQSNIITWLAISDLMACVGILVRSITWLSRANYIPDFTKHQNGSVFCSVMAAWIHFSYSSTYFWTLCYAIDVYLTTKQKIGYPVCYHLISWGLSVLTTVTALVILYAPDFKCHMQYSHIMINYLLTFIPIILVMVVNPVLYVLSSRQVKLLLTSFLGQYSDQERQMLNTLEEKFIYIVLAFYCCWVPNIVNGIILWSAWGNLPRALLVSIWYMMAVLNPLQALLNSLVYRGWNFCSATLRSLFLSPSLQDALLPEPSEITPVLQGSSERLMGSL